METPSPRPLFWISSSRKDLKSFPDQVQDVMGRALLDAQFGDKHPDAKPLHGFGGAGVLEIVDDFAGDTYRTIYTVRFKKRFTYCTRSRRKPREGSPHPGTSWIWCRTVIARRKSIIGTGRREPLNE